MPPNRHDPRKMTAWGDGTYPTEPISSTVYNTYRLYLEAMQPKLEKLVNYANRNKHWLSKALVTEANNLKELWQARYNGAMDTQRNYYLEYFSFFWYGRDPELVELIDRMDGLAEDFSNAETWQTESNIRHISSVFINKDSVPPIPKDPKKAAKLLFDALEKMKDDMKAIQSIPTSMDAYANADWMAEVPKEWMPEARRRKDVTITDSTNNRSISFNVVLKGAIGAGAFGQVFPVQLHGREHHGYDTVAVKEPIFTTDRDTDDIVRRLVREMLDLKGLGEHPNIIPLYGGFRVGHIPYAVFGYGPYGDIWEYLHRHQNADKVKLLRETASGVGFMHSKGYIHCDISPGNVVISPDETAWLIDFGLTKGPNHMLSSATIREHGTWEFKAPEIIENFDITDPEQYEELANGAIDIKGRKSRNKETDVYAFGILIYAILSLSSPYGISWVTDSLQRQKAVDDCKKMVKEGSLRPRLIEVPAASPSGQSYVPAKDLAVRCWAHLPRDRPTMEFVEQNL